MISKRIFWAGLLGLVLPVVGCANPVADEAQVQPLVAGAIPDREPEKLQRLYSKLATYLEGELDIPVKYEPVTDYAAAVTAFKVGDLDLVWFGGLTGVQVRSQAALTEALAKAVDAQMQDNVTTFIEVVLNQELGEPFRRDAMKRPTRVAGISAEDMRPQRGAA